MAGISFGRFIDMASKKIVNLANGSSSGDAVNKGQLDAGVTTAEARSNHTGTQLASTVSDFDTQVRTSRLDQMAAPTNPVALNSQRITGAADPSGAQDVATKNYVDAFVNGLDWKASVRAATTAALAAVTATTTTLTANANGAIAAVDGVTLIQGDALLVKDQAAGAQNGIYTVTTVGSGGAPFVLTRRSDADASVEITAGMVVSVAEGTSNVDKAFILTTNDAITVGTTALVFSQLPGSQPSRIFESDIGNGSSTSFALNHAFGTRNVAVTVYRNSSPWDDIWCEVQRTDTNNVTLVFDSAPSSAEFHAVVRWLV